MLVNKPPSSSAKRGTKVAPRVVMDGTPRPLDGYERQENYQSILKGQSDELAGIDKHSGENGKKLAVKG